MVKPVQLPLISLLRKANAIREDPLSFLEGLSSEYGNAVRLPIGKDGAYYFNHPQAVRRVLQENSRKYSKDTLQWHALQQITGFGLLTGDGEAWLAHRRTAQPAFHRQGNARLLRIINDSIGRLAERWSDYCISGETFLLDREMLMISLDIVGQALFSTDLTPVQSEIITDVITALDTIVYRVSHPFSAPEFIPTRRNRRFVQAIQELDRIIYQMIRDRKNSTFENDDLLSRMLLAQKNTPEVMTDEAIRNEMLTVIIAGHETVAMAMTWAFFLLASHFNAENMVLRELGTTSMDEAYLSRPGTWLRACFQEALRLYPPAWLITRKAIAADEIMGHTISLGAMIILSPYTLHRHPDFWESPSEFKPERFMTPSGSPPRPAYLPFGAGPRMCIGSNFAEIEGQMVIGGLLRRFRILPQTSAPTLEALVTLRPKGGMPVKILPRI